MYSKMGLGEEACHYYDDDAPLSFRLQVMPERIYNPIMAMGFSAMFTFQLDNTKR